MGQLVALALLVLASGVRAELPYTPTRDDDILERIAVPRLAGMASLQELRRAWAEQPRFLPAALVYARAALELSRREEDPRYLGYAEAALRPWWDRQQAPPEVMLLRVALRLARLEHVEAQRDLQLLIDSAAPEAPVARLSRAMLRLSQGKPQEALVDCLAAARFVSPLVAAACRAGARGLAGNAAIALTDIEQALEQAANAPVSTEIGARSVAAELALQLRRPQVASRHFELALRRMRGAETVDPVLLARHADFLLDQGAYRPVLELLEPYQRHDTLLLRLALAQRRLGQAGDGPAADTARRHASRLARRFADMRQRLDRSHLRDEALFELDLRDDAVAALALIRQGWVHVREPVDARIFLTAALRAGQADAADPVLDWIRLTGLDDARLHDAVAALRRAR